jgi:hypothetical protein
MVSNRKPARVSKETVVVSLAIHAVVIVLLLILAAHDAIFGGHNTTIAVTIVPVETPVEEPTPPPIEKPIAKVRVPQPLAVETPKPANLTPPFIRPPPPAKTVPSTPVTTVAPPAASPPVFLFGGGNSIESSSDPELIYKGFLEYTLRSNWQRPENVTNLNYVAEVEIELDVAGNIKGFEWEKGSGNEAWDDSVRSALAQTKTLERPPPKGFPERVLVRFDVQVEKDALKP